MLLVRLLHESFPTARRGHQATWLTCDATHDISNSKVKLFALGWLVQHVEGVIRNKFLSIVRNQCGDKTVAAKHRALSRGSEGERRRKRPKSKHALENVEADVEAEWRELFAFEGLNSASSPSNAAPGTPPGGGKQICYSHV